jgi:hypothetical protein
MNECVAGCLAVGESRRESCVGVDGVACSLACCLLGSFWRQKFQIKMRAETVLSRNHPKNVGSLPKLSSADLFCPKYASAPKSERVFAKRVSAVLSMPFLHQWLRMCQTLVSTFRKSICASAVSQNRPNESQATRLFQAGVSHLHIFHSCVSFCYGSKRDVYRHTITSSIL